MMDAMNFPERMQLLRPRCPEQSVPGIGADPHDAGKPSIRCPKADATHQRGKDCAEISHRHLGLCTRAHRHHEEDGCTSEPGIDGLGTCGNILSDSGRQARLLWPDPAHRYGTHPRGG